MTDPTNHRTGKPWPLDDPLGHFFELLAVLLPLWVAARLALEFAP